MRDYPGYGKDGVYFHWPQNAKIAINFVINYETGAEHSPAEGDDCSESFLVDIPGLESRQGKRNFSAESIFEYGSRCGIWRLHRLFDQYHIPVTVFACGRALEKNSEYTDYLRHSQHEVAGHGYQWIDYRDISAEVEQQHIEKTIKIIRSTTGKQVHGWYTGRRSDHTLDLLAAHNLSYLSDSYADDLPYWKKINDHSQLIIPYSLVTNDFRYTTFPGFSHSQAFYLEVKAAFDFQYQRDQAPQLLTIALHDRLSGRPSRAQAVSQFLQYIENKPNVWITTRADIAKVCTLQNESKDRS